MDPIKPIKKPNRDYLKISLPLAGVVLLMGAVYLTVNNALQQQQDNRSQAALGTNMVANSGFESGTGSWQFNRRSGAGTYAVTTAMKQEGLSSAQLSVTTAAAAPQEIELAQYGKSITAGQTYTVSFWAKAAASRSMSVVAQDGTSPFREYMRKSVPLTTTWQQFTYTFVAPESKSNTFIGLQVGSATGTVYVDNVVYAQGTGSVVSPTSVAPTTAQTGNLLPNPGCESSTSGWTSWQGTLTRVTGIARTGTASCLVARSINDTYTMDDVPSAVRSPRSGEVYSARAWVRSTTSVGKQVRLNIRQWVGSSHIHSFGPYVTLSSSWQEVTHSMTVSGSDRTELDVYLVQENAVAGNSFYVDDFEFYRGNLPPVSTAPTVAPTQAPTATKIPTPSQAPTPTANPNIIFTVQKSSVARGEMQTVHWSNIPNGTPRDWIGLYTPSAANGSEIGWIYLNCTQTATVAIPSGNCTFPIPDTAPAGPVELRLHPNDGNTLLAKSPQFTVVTPGLTLVPTANTTPTSTVPTATKTPTPTVAPTAVQPTNTIMPTATSAPGGTMVTVNLLLHGLGKGGDAVNANGSGNMSPLRPQRTVTVDVFDVQNQLVMSKQGTVTFNATAGNFTGNVDLGSQFNTGIYTVKVKTDQFLRGLVSGIQTITKGQTTNLASLTLVSGDINNDNQINIVDYNIIVGCYSDLLPPVSCTDLNQTRADLTDDGYVNQFDYNLFIRELTNLGGQ